MTHSCTLAVQVDFNFDSNDGKSYGEALAEAIKMAFRPDFGSIANGTVLEAVTVRDPDCGAVISQWESRKVLADYYDFDADNN